MAFEKLQHSRGKKALVGTVSAIGFKPGSAQFFVAEDVAESLALTAGHKVETLRGTESEAGFLAIRKSRQGNRVAKSGRQLNFYVDATASGIVPPAKMTRLPWRIDGDMLVIDVRQLMPTAEVTKIKAD